MRAEGARAARAKLENPTGAARLSVTKLDNHHPREGSRQHVEARAEHQRLGKVGLEEPEVAERQARHTQKRIGRPDFRKSRAERRTAQQQPEDRPEAERKNPLT